MATTTVEERLASIEATLPRLATKADLTKLKAHLARLEAKINRWMVGLMFATIVGASSIAYAAMQPFR
jgi:hypothetical protein